jgi:Phage integrase family
MTAHAFFMAKPPVKLDRDSASDADWQIASQRENAVKVLLGAGAPPARNEGSLGPKSITLRYASTNCVDDVIRNLRRPGQPRNIPVFPHVRSKRSFDTRSWFKPCLASAKITGYVWHCNRHTFCSWLAMSGASIKEIQEAAGHKTITMAARYSHLSPAHLQSVVERIATPGS